MSDSEMVLNEWLVSCGWLVVVVGGRFGLCV